MHSLCKNDVANYQPTLWLCPSLWNMVSIYEMYLRKGISRAICIPVTSMQHDSSIYGPLIFFFFTNYCKRMQTDIALYWRRMSVVPPQITSN